MFSPNAQILGESPKSKCFCNRTVNVENYRVLSSLMSGFQSFEAIWGKIILQRAELDYDAACAKMMLTTLFTGIGEECILCFQKTAEIIC